MRAALRVRARRQGSPCTHPLPLLAAPFTQWCGHHRHVLALHSVMCLTMPSTLQWSMPVLGCLCRRWRTRALIRLLAQMHEHAQAISSAKRFTPVAPAFRASTRRARVLPYLT